MELRRLARQQQRRLYYVKHFRSILNILWLTLLINIALVPILIFLYFSQNKPLYYANNFDGVVTPISPIYNYVATPVAPVNAQP